MQYAVVIRTENRVISVREVRWGREREGEEREFVRERERESVCVLCVCVAVLSREGEFEDPRGMLCALRMVTYQRIDVSCCGLLAVRLWCRMDLEHSCKDIAGYGPWM